MKAKSQKLKNKLSMSIIDIIVPTVNNPDYLYPCLKSIFQNSMTEDFFRVIVVNNGAEEIMKPLLDQPGLDIVQMPKNMGWEGGLKAGLEYSKAPFVVFMNDDTFVPQGSRLWLNRMLDHFAYPDCAAVGPTSNCVMGLQNIFAADVPDVFRVSYLIGFCVMIRRAHLDEVGGVDDSMPNHGDDLDLSIRLRKIGKYLICDRNVFIYHHGFKTGQRLQGDYWNSAMMKEKTDVHLQDKYGFKEWFNTRYNQYRSMNPWQEWEARDVEAECVKKYAAGNILELGCGPIKTVPDSVGVDIIPAGQRIPGLKAENSVADIEADVSKEIPVPHGTFDTVIARHILEHIPDLIETITMWGKPLKTGGRLIIAVPNHELRNTIPLNIQHVHAFTPSSLKNLMVSQGWKFVAEEDPQNRISFVQVWEKNGVH